MDKSKDQLIAEITVLAEKLTAAGFGKVRFTIEGMPADVADRLYQVRENAKKMDDRG